MAPLDCLLLAGGWRTRLRQRLVLGARSAVAPHIKPICERASALALARAFLLRGSAARGGLGTSGRLRGSMSCGPCTTVAVP